MSSNMSNMFKILNVNMLKYFGQNEKNCCEILLLVKCTRTRKHLRPKTVNKII